jgi:hypothetical protein
MNRVEVVLDGTERRFRPGDTVSGRARWSLESPPRVVMARLFWRTSGRGTADLKVVDEVRFESPAARGEQPFRFKLPASPYSFSGKLISLVWAVEVVTEPSDTSAHEDFVLSATGREVTLAAIDDRT